MWSGVATVYDLIAIRRFIAGRGYREQKDNPSTNEERCGSSRTGRARTTRRSSST